MTFEGAFQNMVVGEGKNRPLLGITDKDTDAVAMGYVMASGHCLCWRLCHGCCILCAKRKTW